MKGGLNLARTPFVNRRPMRRTGRALLVLGLLLTVTNGFLFARYLVDSADLRGQLRQVRDAIAAEQQEIDRAGRQLASFDLESQNARVEFLNARIAERTFAWSRLFEELGEVLPLGVRLRQLTPVMDQARTRTGMARAESVELSINGQARNSDDLLELLDTLFQHPSFERPRLTSESRDGSLISFALNVSYRTGHAAESMEPSGESAEAEGEGGASTVAADEGAEADALEGSPPAPAESPLTTVEPGVAAADTPSPERSGRTPASPSSPSRQAPPRPIADDRETASAPRAGAPEAGADVAPRSPALFEAAVPSAARSAPAPESAGRSAPGATFSPRAAAPGSTRPTPRRPSASAPPGGAR